MADDPSQLQQSNTNNDYAHSPALTISNVAVMITSVSPSSYGASSNDQTMTVNGSNFHSGVTLTFHDPQGNAYPSKAIKMTFVSNGPLCNQRQGRRR